jgi:hypothetical protein
MTVYVTAWLWLITSVFGGQDQVELVCMRRQVAANACHYNFLINGMPYRYVDNGCRENRDTVMKKARQGKLALAKDWKIDCPPGKDN